MQAFFPPGGEVCLHDLERVLGSTSASILQMRVHGTLYPGHAAAVAAVRVDDLRLHHGLLNQSFSQRDVVQ